MTAAMAPVAVTSKLRIRPGADEAFAAWQARYTLAITGFPGFLSVEIVPVLADAADWRIVQHFRSAEQLARWRESDERRALLGDLRPLRDLDHDDAEEPAPDFHSQNEVTEVIATVVKPGRERDYRAWHETMLERQGRFPGYRGTYIQAPVSPEQPHWTTLVRFATRERLEAWLASDERRELLPGVEPLVERWESRRLTSFAGWFQAGARRSASAALKQTALVLLVLFPVVMLERRFLGPQLDGWNPAAATFVGNVISVFLLSWPLVPLAIRGLGWWLEPRLSLRTELLGLGTLLLLYAIEIAALWHLV